MVIHINSTLQKIFCSVEL